MMPPPRRKKWTEAEERTLIDRYGEMIRNGTLAKMKTREKKFKPIALYVNSVHHSRDPITHPWEWTWKDVSTKVQNMRHQYALVKQKIKKPDSMGDLDGELFDWMDGRTHWSNFLRYKEVFGDVELVLNSNDSMVVADGNDDIAGGFDGSAHRLDIAQFEHLGHSGDGDFGAGIDGVDNGVMGLEFDYDGEEGEGNYKGENHAHMKDDGDNGFVYEDIEPSGSYMRKKRRMLRSFDSKQWGFLANQLGQLREMESRFEQRETEREQERQRREQLWMEMQREWDQKWNGREKEREERKNTMDKLRRQQILDWEAMDKESEERERRRSEEELMYDREWEERLNRRRSEWKKRIDEMLNQHRAEIGQMQTRILHEQQSFTNQLLGFFSHWSGQPTGLPLPDHTGASSHYLSQMMQNLHHVNDGIVHGDTRVEGDNQEDQFI